MGGLLGGDFWYSMAQSVSPKVVRVRGAREGNSLLVEVESSRRQLILVRRLQAVHEGSRSPFVGAVAVASDRCSHGG